MIDIFRDPLQLVPPIRWCPFERFPKPGSFALSGGASSQTKLKPESIMADLKQVKQVCQKDKKIVYGYIKMVQAMLPSEENPYYIIVQLIQDLILLCFHRLIDTRILTKDEQSKLYEMVNNYTNNKFGEWRLLYRASRDGGERDEFYKKCDKIDNTLCVIQSIQGDDCILLLSIKWW